MPCSRTSECVLSGEITGGSAVWAAGGVRRILVRRKSAARFAVSVDLIQRSVALEIDETTRGCDVVRNLDLRQQNGGSNERG